MIAVRVLYGYMLLLLYAPSRTRTCEINALEERCLIHLAIEAKFYGGNKGIRTLEAPFEAYLLSREATSTTRPHFHLEDGEGLEPPSDFSYACFQGKSLTN